jgi:LPXTG-motif cell wall-anchored protein
MSTTTCRCFLFTVLLLNAVASTAEETRVKGRVVDRDAGGAGLPGANVSIWLHRKGDPNPIPVCASPTHTDWSGAFDFPCELQRKPVKLSVSRMAYLPNPKDIWLTMTARETKVKGEPPFDKPPTEGIPLYPVEDVGAYFKEEARLAARQVLSGASSLEEQATAVRKLGLRPEEEQMFLAALTRAVQEDTTQQQDQLAWVDTDEELPMTGSALALVGGAGLGALAAAFALRRRRRHARR